MNWFSRLAIKEKIFLLTLAIFVLVWLPPAFVVRTILAPKLGYEFFGFLAGALVVFLVLARRLAEHITRPIVSLTRLADEISEGKLDVSIDFGNQVKCWEIKGCRETQCPVHGRDDLICWFVDGTPCRDCVPRFPDKLVQCRRCLVYRTHRGDEIVQLADSFKHMLNELKASRWELERSNRLQDGVISHAFEGIIGSDLEGNVRIFNEAVVRLTGYPADEALGGMKIYDFFPLEFASLLRRCLEQRSEVESLCCFDHDTQCKTVREDFVPVKATAIFLQRGRDPFGLVCFIKDVREIESLRERLLQSERMAVIGEVTSALSHGIRNIIDGMRGGSYVLNSGRKKQSWDLVAKGWEMIDRNIQRIDALLYQLLNVTDTKELNRIPFDINALLEEAASLLRDRLMEASVRLESRWGGPNLLAEVDPDAIRLCFFNILQNAIEACETAGGRKGRITIETRAADEDWIQVTVRDNGIGMDRATLDRLFRGAFSTKGPASMGLGLFVAGKLVKRHGGRLDIESRMNRGTCVTVLLARKAGEGRRRSPGQGASGREASLS